MSNQPVDYDEISHTFDQRYTGAYKPEGIASKLTELVRTVEARKVLEVGCGTGYWLDIVHALAPCVCGVDNSAGMLQKARERKTEFLLVRGDAECFPFKKNIFDVAYCVNAIHFFNDPAGYIKEAHESIRSGGTLSIVGMDPHAGRDTWFLYDYFPGTYETDLGRYPSTKTIADWMIAAGFQNVTSKLGERLMIKRVGREILPLDKNFTSQLTLLSSEAFADGIARIEAALSRAEAEGRTLEFVTDISLAMTTGWVA